MDAASTGLRHEDSVCSPLDYAGADEMSNRAIDERM